jgi:hypothetical protein
MNELNQYKLFEVSTVWPSTQDFDGDNYLIFAPSVEVLKQIPEFDNLFGAFRVFRNGTRTLKEIQNKKLGTVWDGENFVGGPSKWYELSIQQLEKK